MALPKQHRLRSSRSFSTVYRQGKRAGSRCLGVKALKITSPDENSHGSISSGVCIGVSISRKVHKRAVVRNRIKRQIHAALTTLLPRVHGTWWVVINVRSAATVCEYYEFLRELENLLVELEVLYGN